MRSAVLPVLHDLSSITWDGQPIRTREPISFGLALEIGDGDSPGADLFYLSVCNPAFLSSKAYDDGWVWQDQMLVLETLSFENVRIAVARKIEAMAPYPSWAGFAEQMAPFMGWEFAGMP